MVIWVSFFHSEIGTTDHDSEIFLSLNPNFMAVDLKPLFPEI